MTDHFAQEPVFRVDRFIVPNAARQGFLDRVLATRAFLDTLDGCRQNLVLEEPLDAARSRVVTIVEWRDVTAFEQAKAAAAARYRATGFNPGAFVAASGVEAELGNYALVA